MWTPLIAAHALTAGVALLLGPVVLLRRRKGDGPHRLLGAVWLVAMYVVCLTSFGITELRPGRFSWIHGLSAFTLVGLTLGVRAAVRADVRAHRAHMVGAYLGLLGAFLAASAVPGRLVPRLVDERPLLAVAALVLVVGVAGVACRAAGVLPSLPRPHLRARSSGSGLGVGRSVAPQHHGQHRCPPDDDGERPDRRDRGRGVSSRQ